MSISAMLPFFSPLPTLSPVLTPVNPFIPPAQQLLSTPLLSLATTNTTSSNTPGCGQPNPHLRGSPAHNLTIVTADGKQRSYLLHIPLSYDIWTPAPLIFALHGRTRTAAGMERLTGFSDDSVNGKAIVVYPQGIDVSSFFFPFLDLGILGFGAGLWRLHC